MNSRGLITLALTLATLTLPGALRAQRPRPLMPDLKNSSHAGLGYVVSPPNMFVGFTALVLSPDIFGGAGLYADVRMTHNSPGGDPYFLPDISVTDAEATYGDRLYQEESAWLAVDLAAVYVWNRDFAVYLGGGYARERHYREYFDDSVTRGFEGFYWVLDDAASGNRVNALVGAFFRAGKNVMFQMGLESRPGANIGVMLMLPF